MAYDLIPTVNILCYKAIYDKGCRGLFYSSWNENATCKNAKRLFRQYKGWKEEVSHLKLETSLSAIQYDGMPSSQTNRNGTEEALIQQISDLDDQRYKLEHQIMMVNSTIDVMGEPTEQAYQLATLLRLRYIERWKVVKCCEKLATLFGTEDGSNFVSESKFHRDEREALLLFTRIYPNRDQIIVKINDQI